MDKDYNVGEAWKYFWDAEERLRRSCQEKLDSEEWRRDPAYKLVAESIGDAESVLDIACGCGIQYPAIKEHNPEIRYVGIDIADAALEFARGRFPDVEFSKGDVRNLPYEDGEFDMAIIRHLLEHHYPDSCEDIIVEALRVAAKKLVIVFFHEPLKEIALTEPLRSLGVGSGGMPVNLYSYDWIFSCISEYVGGEFMLVERKVENTPDSPALTNQAVWEIIKGGADD